MSLVSPSQVMALVKTTLAEDDVQDVIDREEAYLAAELRSPLTGTRTQSIWRKAAPFTGDVGPIRLIRPTDEVDEVRDDGVILDEDDFRLLEGGTLIERVGFWTGPLIEVDYTPNDQANVERVVIELCRLTLTETGFNSESFGGDFMYQRSGIKPATSHEIQMASRRALVRSLQTRTTNGTASLRPAGRITPVYAS